MERERSTFIATRSKWNKKLEALGLPRIPQDLPELPATFAEYVAANHPEYKEEKRENTGVNKAGNSLSREILENHVEALLKLERLALENEAQKKVIDSQARRIKQLFDLFFDE